MTILLQLFPNWKRVLFKQGLIRVILTLNVLMLNFPVDSENIKKTQKIILAGRSLNLHEINDIIKILEGVCSPFCINICP